MLNTQSTILLNNISSSSSQNDATVAPPATGKSSEVVANTDSTSQLPDIPLDLVKDGDSGEAKSFQELLDISGQLTQAAEQENLDGSVEINGNFLPPGAVSEFDLSNNKLLDVVVGRGAIKELVADNPLNIVKNEDNKLNATFEKMSLENSELLSSEQPIELARDTLLDETTILSEESPIQMMPLEWQENLDVVLEKPSGDIAIDESLALGDLTNSDEVGIEDIPVPVTLKDIDPDKSAKATLLADSEVELLRGDALKRWQTPILNTKQTADLKVDLPQSEKTIAPQTIGISGIGLPKNNNKVASSATELHTQLKSSNGSKSFLDSASADLKLLGANNAVPLNRVSEVNMAAPITSTTQSMVIQETAGFTGDTKAASAPSTQSLNGLSEPLQIYSKNWQQNFSRHIQWMQHSGVNSAEIQLDPADLGPITIKVSTQGGETQVSIQTAHNQTRELLDQNQQRLKEMMEQNGMSLSHFDVSGDGLNDQQESEEETAKSIIAAESDVVDSETTAQRNSTQITMSGLDYFV